MWYEYFERFEDLKEHVEYYKGVDMDRKDDNQGY